MPNTHLMVTPNYPEGFVSKQFPNTPSGTTIESLLGNSVTCSDHKHSFSHFSGDDGKTYTLNSMMPSYDLVLTGVWNPKATPNTPIINVSPIADSNKYKTGKQVNFSVTNYGNITDDTQETITYEWYIDGSRVPDTSVTISRTNLSVGNHIVYCYAVSSTGLKSEKSNVITITIIEGVAVNLLITKDEAEFYAISGKTSDGKTYQTTWKDENGNGGYYTWMRVDRGTNTKMSKNKILSNIQLNWTVELDTMNTGYAKITYTVSNLDSIAHTVDLMFCADIQIGDNDKAPVDKTSYGITMSDSTSSDAHRFNVFARNKPFVPVSVNTIWIGQTLHAAHNIAQFPQYAYVECTWNHYGEDNGTTAYPGATEPLPGTNLPIITGDSGFNMSWTNISLNARQNRQFIYYINME